MGERFVCPGVAPEGAPVVAHCAAWCPHWQRTTALDRSYKRSSTFFNGKSTRERLFLQGLQNIQASPDGLPASGSQELERKREASRGATDQSTQGRLAVLGAGGGTGPGRTRSWLIYGCAYNARTKAEAVLAQAQRLSTSFKAAPHYRRRTCVICM